jgi:hypothetical protein
MQDAESSELLDWYRSTFHIDDDAKAELEKLIQLCDVSEDTILMMLTLHRLEQEHPQRSRVEFFTVNSHDVQDALDGDECAKTVLRVKLMRHLNDAVDRLGAPTDQDRADELYYNTEAARQQRHLRAYNERQKRALQGLGERPNDPEGQARWDALDRKFKKAEIDRRIDAREMRMHPSLKERGVYWRCRNLVTTRLNKVNSNEIVGFHKPITEILADMSHYAGLVPATNWRDFGTISRNIVADRNRHMGDKHYKTFDQFAQDMRLVCFNAMVAWPVKDTAYEKARDLLTGGEKHDKWQDCCIDRALVAIHCDEFDLPYYPTPEPVQPSFGDWLDRVFNGKTRCSYHHHEPTEERRRSNELCQRNTPPRSLGPRLSHEPAAYHARRLVEDLRAHPCSIALTREYMEPFSQANGPRIFSLEDLERLLSAGSLDSYMALYVLKDCLGSLFATADRLYHQTTGRLWKDVDTVNNRRYYHKAVWLDNDGNAVQTSPVGGLRLSITKLRHMADACKTFFYKSKWEIRSEAASSMSGEAPEKRASSTSKRKRGWKVVNRTLGPVVFSRIETLMCLETET